MAKYIPIWPNYVPPPAYREVCAESGHKGRRIVRTVQPCVGGTVRVCTHCGMTVR